ncbi:MAG: diaminopimelate epimerase [Acidobacteria bacterium]|nr:diaminopimelate epimerase [Acidobacteriota bacterium]
MHFYKFQASGNDFLVIEEQHLPATPSLDLVAERLCDRHYGAGADGLLVVRALEEHDEADFQMRVFNADGSEAEMSGNGIRCAAAYLYYTGQWTDATMSIATKAGVRRLRRLREQGQTIYFEVEMGRPKLASNEIPMSLEPPLPRVLKLPLRVGEDVFHITACSMGNPHCSLILRDIDSIDFTEIGARIENHSIFPERTNVEFVKVMSRDRLMVLFWERGVGETLSSGTGACAAAVAAMLNGLVDRKVQVLTRAGELSVHWRDDGVVVLVGPVEVVYRGEWLTDLP